MNSKKTYICSEIIKLLANARFDREYIKSHSKEDYLSLDEQIRLKIEANDYYIADRNAVIFLDDGKPTDTD